MERIPTAESPTLVGAWFSEYEYGKGPGGLAQHSTHTVDITGDVHKGYVGISRPSSENSRLALTLNYQRDKVYAGEWQEQTASEGAYKGQVFEGRLMFVLKEGGMLLEGMWLGPNRSNSQINSGKWWLRREL